MSKYSSCKSIMPKFLWKYVIRYLLVGHVIKMSNLDRYFMAITEYKSMKHCIMANINSNIILVKCNANRIDNFWIHAWNNHKCYTRLHYALDQTPTDSGYYKILIKPGQYMLGCNVFKINCNIEISGVHDFNMPIITTNTQFNQFHISCNISISNLVFNDINLGFNTPIPKMEQTYVNISNCIFGSGSTLKIQRINRATISNCKFNTGYIILGEKRYYIYENVKDDNLPKINYDIINNNFTDTKFGCIIFRGKQRNASTINITDNVVSNCGLLCNISMERASIYFTNNIFTNMVSCVDSYNESAFITFKSNTFTNVNKLYHYGNGEDVIKLDTSNEFTDCGIDLTKYAI